MVDEIHKRYQFRKLAAKMMMTLVLFGLGGLLGFWVCFNRCFPYEHLRALSDHIRQKTSGGIGVSQEKPTLFLLGDSLVRRGDWRLLEKDFAPVNLGQGGARVRDVILSLENFSWVRDSPVILLVGVNDFTDRSDLETITNSFRQLLVLCRKRGLTVTVCAIPEVPGTDDFDRRAAIRALNFRLQKIAQDAEQDFFDCQVSLRGSDGKIAPRFMRDRLHLTGEAYREFVPELLIQMKRK